MELLDSDPEYDVYDEYITQHSYTTMSGDALKDFLIDERDTSVDELKQRFYINTLPRGYEDTFEFKKLIYESNI